MADPKPEVTPGTPSAPGGEYRLVVDIWNEIVSKVGEARRFVKHVKDDVVTLTSEDADRLLRAGAVAPLSAEAKAAAADIGLTPIDAAKAVNATQGPQPVNDPNAAAGATAVNQAR